MTPWWTAQNILRKALRAPFQARRTSLVVFAVFVFPILTVLIGFKLLQMGFLFDRNLGTTFFSPDGRVDPVFLQHALWLGGSPEFQALLAVLILPLVAWAQAIWFQGQFSPVTFRVGWGHWGRILSVYLTAAIAMAFVGMVSFIFPILVLTTLPIGLFVLFCFAPVMTASVGGVHAAWRFSGVKISVVLWCVVDCIVLLFLLAIPAGVFEVIARADLMAPGPSRFGLSYPVADFLAFCARCLAWVYALFVVTAMIAGLAQKGQLAQAELFR